MSGSPTEPRREGLAAALAEARDGGGYDVSAAVGGWRGIVDATVPSTLFLLVWSVTQQLRPALYVALAVAVLLTAERLVRREKVQYALSGLVGIGLCALVAAKTGRAQDFYLPSLIKNAAYAAAYVVSILVRWPLIGLVAGTVTGRGTAWRRDPAAMRAFSLASWIWVAMFALRFAAQLPLYLAGAVTTLGIVNIFLGLPLFALTIWLTWLLVRDVVRHVPPPGSEVQPTDAEPPTPEAAEQDTAHQ